MWARHGYRHGLSLTVIIAGQVNFLFIKIKKKKMVKTCHSIYSICVANYLIPYSVGIWKLAGSQYFYHYN